MSENFKSYETERLILKPSNVEDKAFVLELLNTPKWIENIGDRKVKTLEDAENYILKKMIPQLKRLGYSNYTVIRKSDGAKIGSCGLYDRPGLEGVDIGFAFLPEFEKQGYAFESSSKILALAKDDFGIKELSAITIRSNIASQKLIEKLGFKFEKMTKLPDDNEEVMVYKLYIAR